MSLLDWVRFGWLSEHKSSPEEIKRLLALADRDLQACKVKDLDTDWSFTIAYNAALQVATAALAASGYRASRDSHHYRIFQSLEHTLQPDSKVIAQLDVFRKKRNLTNYEFTGSVSNAEASAMRALAARLRADVERWIREKYPELL